MAVNGFFAKCAAPIFDAILKLDDDIKVNIFNSPINIGRIKSLMCCRKGKSCSVA